jgi:hypothetical protein
VLWRFCTTAHENAESRAARVAGALLFALAAITSVASLLGYSEPKPTLLGIAILVAAAVVMPWLAKEKRRLSGATGSAALRADAAQSALCAYLSLIALVGLAINAIWSVKWADPIAALAVLPLIVWEGLIGSVGKKPQGPRSVPLYPAETISSRTESNVCVRLQLVATSMIPQLTGAVPIRIVMSFVAARRPHIS